MKLYLIVTKGKKQGLPIPIQIDLFVLGTDPSCQLHATCPGVAPQHCAILTRERKVFVRDLDSGESTVVNGEAMPSGEEWPLHAGDHLAVGPLEFLVQFMEKPLSQRDIEEWALRCLDNDSGKIHYSAVEELEAVAKRSMNAESASSAAASILDHLQAQRGIVQGRLRISREEGVTILRINDVYLVEEAELAHLKKELHDHLALPNLRVLLDFKMVRRMSSTAAELFAELTAWLRPWGSTLAICRLRPELQEALQSLKGMEGIHFYPDKRLALAARW